ncbi:MAG: class I SAM-dependent methyltransferase [Dongiaceae bacterium]
MTEDWFALNRRRWDEVAGIHPGTKFYGVDRFKAGENSLLPLELAEVGDVAGKSLLHLQCHFGLDSLNWARLGARVTGLDFSSEAIRQARKLAAETGLAAEFVEANVYDAAQVIDRQFDIVFVSWGALCWLPDLRRWAEIVMRLLAPGGFLYVLEGHPTANILEQTERTGAIFANYPYFNGAEPVLFHVDKTYADDLPVKNKDEATWLHPMSTILSSILNVGLSIEFFREHQVLAWPLFPCMTKGEDGYWRLPADRPSLPLSFSLKASKHG